MRSRKLFQGFWYELTLGLHRVNNCESCESDGRRTCVW